MLLGTNPKPDLPATTTWGDPCVFVLDLTILFESIVNPPVDPGDWVLWTGCLDHPAQWGA